MSMINLAKDYRLFSPEELREYIYKGLVEINGYDATDMFEYIFQGVIFKADVDKIVQEARDEWDEEDDSSGLRDRIERAISDLEGDD